MISSKDLNEYPLSKINNQTHNKAMLIDIFF